MVHRLGRLQLDDPPSQSQADLRQPNRFGRIAESGLERLSQQRLADKPVAEAPAVEGQQELSRFGLGVELLQQAHGSLALGFDPGLAFACHLDGAIDPQLAAVGDRRLP